MARWRHRLSQCPMFPGGQFVKSAGFISSATPIVVCIAARVINKMSMMTTVHVGWRQSRGDIHIMGAPTFFFWTGVPLGVNPALNHTIILRLSLQRVGLQTTCAGSLDKREAAGSRNQWRLRPNYLSYTTASIVLVQSNVSNVLCVAASRRPIELYATQILH